MKLSRVTLVIIIACLLCTTTVSAQPLGPDGPPVDVLNNPPVYEDGVSIHQAPNVGLNWAFGAGDGYELDCGEMWSVPRSSNMFGIEYGGWLSAGLTVNSWNNDTMLGNSQLPLNNDPHLNMNQLWGWIALA